MLSDPVERRNSNERERRIIAVQCGADALVVGSAGIRDIIPPGQNPPVTTAFSDTRNLHCVSKKGPRHYRL